AQTTCCPRAPRSKPGADCGWPTTHTPRRGRQVCRRRIRPGCGRCAGNCRCAIAFSEVDLRMDSGELRSKRLLVKSQVMDGRSGVMGCDFRDETSRHAMR